MAGIALIAVAGCTLGPDFARPFTQASDKNATFINDVYAENSAYDDMNLWWERIDDPLLNDYIAQLLNENLALMQAAERIVQANARSDIAGGSYFPSVGADASATRSFTSNFGNIGGFGGSQRNYNNSYEAALNSSWQIDLFGKIRRSVEAADAAALASVYDRNALVHSLIAQLVNVRVEIATQKSLLELAKKSAQNRQDTLEIIERRYEIGASNTDPQDVLRARNNVSVAQGDVNRAQRLLADAAYRLDVLLGQAPGTIDPLAGDFPMMAPPVDAPICLPANLLDRRPDLRAAELRVRAANADIGVAIADLYPSLSLGGSIGFSGNEATSNLFSAENLAGSILASITSRIFEGGSLRRNIDLQKSEARELAAGYAEEVLNAMREVETNLKAESELATEIEYAGDSVEELTKAVDIIEKRYMRGIATLRDLLETQQELYAAEQNLVNVQATKWNARTALYLALGGDWFGSVPTLGCGNAQIDEDLEGRDDGEI